VAKDFSRHVNDGTDVFDPDDDKVGTDEVNDASGADKSSSGACTCDGWLPLYSRRPASADYKEAPDE